MIRALYLDASVGRLAELAANVGRLWQRTSPAAESSEARSFDRIAADVESLDAMLHPTAGELCRENLAACGDECVSVAEALAARDARTRRLRRLMGQDEEGRWKPRKPSDGVSRHYRVAIEDPDEASVAAVSAAVVDGVSF